MKVPAKSNAPARTIDAIGVGICLLLAGLVFFVGIQPMLDRREAAQQRRQQLREHQAQAERLEQSLTAMHRQLARTRRAVADHPLRLAPVDALNRRVSDITELAQDSGISIDRVRPGDRVAAEHYQTVAIRVQGTGGFEHGAAFLHRLHEELPDLAVAEFSLTDQGVRSRSPKMELELHWYAAPPAGSDEPESGKQG